MLATAAAARSPLPTYKLYLEKPGAYQVRFEDLPAACGPLASAGLGLTNAGRPVPVWVEDGGDGVFGPGDHVEFLGEHLPGEVSYSSEHSRFNVYVLRFDRSEPARMTPIEATPTPPFAGFRSCSNRQHLEEDRLILRLSRARGDGPQELWYWAKLAHSHRRPLAQTLDLRDLAPDPERSVELRIAFRGWSRPKRKSAFGVPDHGVPDHGLSDHRVPDHTVELWLNGERILTDEWSGTEPHLLEIPPLSADRFLPGDNTLAFKVPARTAADGGETLIDVVMLNWIEITYPRAERIADRQAFCELAASQEPAPVRLVSEPHRRILVYGSDGSRIAAGGMAAQAEDGDNASIFIPAAAVTWFVAADGSRLYSPDAIVRDRPSRLAATGRRADYIMIAHSSLLEAVEPLATFHRARGLEVTVVDVEDVYDEFSHGLIHPRALRAFLDHAYHDWQPPAPRFVLLVGDASWDGKNPLANNVNYADWTYRPGETQRFVKNKTTLYEEEADRNHRGLIPTWNYHTYQGHSASDNYFVTVAGGDRLPDLAIGRLPVVEPAEVAQIVAKTIAYATSRDVGPWRRSVLLITNESRGFQRWSDRLAGLLAEDGFAARKIYPASSEVSNEINTRKILETLNGGQLLVHFLGHGGRYIWRTGPPDLKKNHDLFTLDHLDQLEPTVRLPIVLSLTCYSAPFDHPNADSIGEKLLRLAGKGAVAVFAASWRNSPSPKWGQVLMRQLTTPGATVGEAVARAKREVKAPMFVETYNLLGDPALPVALPSGRVALGAVWSGDRWKIRGAVELGEFAGEVLVDLTDAAGEVLETIAVQPGGRQFELEIESPAAHTVRAYAWDSARGLDAAGALLLPEPPSPVAAAALSADRARSER